MKNIINSYKLLDIPTKIGILVSVFIIIPSCVVAMLEMLLIILIKI
jgi:hypothetical protein